MKEVTVAKVNEFRDREMRQIAVEDSQILLAKIDDRFLATGAFCPHYGTPLATGILCSKKIICPWHNACFSIQDGSLLEPPALDGLPSFPVRIEGDNVLVELPEEILDRSIPKMATENIQKDDRVFVILGAGAAGSIAAETLRQAGFPGKIILISKEDKLPYDRTKLSKNYLQGNASADSLPLRSCEFYQENDIELYFDRTVTQVDPSNKTIIFADNSTLNYDSLLLATGGKPRRLDLPGSNLANIFTLRQTEDVDRIIESVNNATNRSIGLVGLCRNDRY
jgi:nitrite reductase/ring-hydroxylating ferredoxin subunit